MKLHVAFLWHMHQPLYLDPLTDSFIMPWVRLHAVKAYNDMIDVILDRDDTFVTFNFVPSLLYQIQSYIDGKRDKFWELSKKPPQYLEHDERLFILKNFFSCFWPTMVEKYERYRYLLSLRGREPSSNALQEAVKKFTNQDLLDLQTWFNLTWLGFSLQKRKDVQELIKKGKNFTESERDFVLDLHIETMKNLLPKYKKKLKEHVIDISTTPFYHPIMPLLYDTNIAKVSNKHTKLPDRFSYPEDVLSQLLKGRDYYREIFEHEPQGLWPSEGSVSMEVIDLFIDAGFLWAATDESVLFSSLDHQQKDSLFMPYKTEFSKKPFYLIFRHHHLSDKIGFIYKNMSPNDAVNDFVHRLIEIKNHIGSTDRPPVIAIILDGENPWEYFHDGGEAFLNGIYNNLAKSNDLQLTTITDYITKYPATRTLKRLHPASWINNDFGIWIGGQEENRAWNLLKKTRDTLENAIKDSNVPRDRIEKAKESIYIAEGSDWFWWYGNKFHTDFAAEFDYLFRSHLQNVYIKLGLPVPFEITQPIKPPKIQVKALEPTALIEPKIDGLHTHYLEWYGAGSISFDNKGGAMFTGESLIKEIKYGFNLNYLFIKIYPGENFLNKFSKNDKIRILFNCKNIDYSLILCNQVKWMCNFYVNQEVLTIPEDLLVEFMELFEIQIPFRLFNANSGDTIHFLVEILQEELVVERLPLTGSITIVVPDEDFEKRIWMV